jgi:two-component system, OmpR family, sensor kinase
MRHSIQFQIQLWHGVILALVLLAFGALAMQLTTVNQTDLVDQELAAQLDNAMQPAGPMMEPPGSPQDMGGPLAMRPRMAESIQNAERQAALMGKNVYFLWLDEQGERLAGSKVDRKQRLVEFAREAGVELGKPMRGPVRRQDHYETVGENRELLRILPFGDVVLIGRSMRPELSATRKQMLGFALSGLAMLAMGLAGGWWLTRRALAPIGDISRTATEIAAGDLSRRIPVAEQKSELGELAEVLNDSFGQLEAAFERQARFTADASHELRTPLSVILTKTQSSLNKERTVAEYQEALKVCQRAAQRMRTLTESLLALSRIDAKEQIGHNYVDLGNLADDCIFQLDHRIEEKQHNVNTDLASVKTRGDAVRLNQVITNLLTNAIKFTPVGGTIAVKTYAEGAEARIVVEDNGPGIPEEDLPHIFDRFYRADASRSLTAGSGLGLSIALAVVQGYKGTILASNRPTGGARFEVRLPIS